jgi:hypothetical protein
VRKLYQFFFPLFVLGLAPAIASAQTTITGLSPSSAAPGFFITITGSGFGATQGSREPTALDAVQPPRIPARSSAGACR